MARGPQHRVDRFPVQPAGPDLGPQLAARPPASSAGRCGRGSVIAWYTSAAASSRSDGVNAAAVSPLRVPGAVQPLMMAGGDLRGAGQRAHPGQHAVGELADAAGPVRARWSVSRPGLSQIAVDTPTRPRSWISPARRRVVRIVAGRPETRAASAARLATPREWPAR